MDEQWEIIYPLLPDSKSAPGKKGRPAQDKRQVLNGIIWICLTGAQWQDILTIPQII